jgi:hypothetical protein
MSRPSPLARLRARLLGADLVRLDERTRSLAGKLDAILAHQARDAQERESRRGAADATVQEILRRLDGLERGIGSLENHARSQRDDIPTLRRALSAAREAPEYETPFREKEPLVSVRIASYGDPETLVDVALASVRAQTYTRLEVIVVNDGPDEANRRAVESLRDDRIRYVELPFRRAYPGDAKKRWMVAGSPGMNEGARLATGKWIAPLDDDDAFAPDHVERLLALARENRAEVAYGAALQVDAVTGDEARIHAFPPERGGFTFQAALLHRALRVFEYDEESWRVAEPGDWNLCRRMVAAGVRFAACDDEVVRLNRVPYSAKPRD